MTAAPTPAREQTIEIPSGAFYGQMETLTATMGEAGPEGTPGRYRVVFTLERPGFSKNDPFHTRFDQDIPGDSYIRLAPDVTQTDTYATTPDGQFRFEAYPNEEGRLGRIVSEFEARDFNDAEERAHRALLGSLSLWSATMDVPIGIARVYIRELATGCEQVSRVTPYPDTVLFTNPVARPEPEMRGYASLYREAVNSNSPAYRLLCLFKIVDAIGARRRRLGAEARAKKIPFSRPAEGFPENPEEFVPWLNAIFYPPRRWDQTSIDSIFLPEVLGRAFRPLETGPLNDVRVKVAHALTTESGEPRMNSDDLLNVRVVQRWLPVVTCMARRMLKNEFPGEFLPFVTEPRTGTLIPP